MVTKGILISCLVLAGALALPASFKVFLNERIRLADLKVPRSVVVESLPPVAEPARPSRSQTEARENAEAQTNAFIQAHRAGAVSSARPAPAVCSAGPPSAPGFAPVPIARLRQPLPSNEVWVIKTVLLNPEQGTLTDPGGWAAPAQRLRSNEDWR